MISSKEGRRDFCGVAHCELGSAEGKNMSCTVKNWTQRWTCSIHWISSARWHETLRILRTGRNPQKIGRDMQRASKMGEGIWFRQRACRKRARASDFSRCIPHRGLYISSASTVYVSLSNVYIPCQLTTYLSFHAVIFRHRTYSNQGSNVQGRNVQHPSHPAHTIIYIYYYIRLIHH